MAGDATLGCPDEPLAEAASAWRPQDGDAGVVSGVQACRDAARLPAEICPSAARSNWSATLQTPHASTACSPPPPSGNLHRLTEIAHTGGQGRLDATMSTGEFYAFSTTPARRSCQPLATLVPRAERELSSVRDDRHGQSLTSSHPARRWGSG